MDFSIVANKIWMSHRATWDSMFSTFRKYSMIYCLPISLVFEVFALSQFRSSLAPMV
jgi:hypothetical protein